MVEVDAMHQQTSTNDESDLLQRIIAHGHKNEKTRKMGDFGEFGASMERKAPGEQ